MTTFHTVEETCPVCDETVEVRHLMSTNTFGGQDTDLRTRAVGWDPLHIAIATCPACGYSDLAHYFSKPRPDLTEAIGQRVREAFAPLRDERVTTSVGYSRAARIAIWRGAGPLEIADLFLRAAWCCADEGDAQGEHTYRLAAIEYFEQALATGQLGEELQPVITYLVGELYRRVGQAEQAAIWFDRVLVLDGSLQESLDWVLKAARQQRDTPRERFR